MGMEVDMDKLFGTLYNKALEGDKDCGGLLSNGNFPPIFCRPTFILLWQL